MKILITTDTYLPNVNGVVTSILNLYKQLKVLGHDVRILTLSDRGYDYKDGDVYYLKSFKVNIYPDARVRYLFNKRLINEIIKWKPDIVHSQTEFSTIIDAKHISSKLKIPQVHTYHTMYEDYLGYFMKGLIINKAAAAKLTSLLLNTFDGVIAPTEKVKNALISYGVNTDISVVPTGIDIIKFSKVVTNEERNELRRRYNLSSDDNVLLYLGRIAKEKNIEEIIDLFQKLNTQNSANKLLIVGGGPYLHVLKEKVQCLGLTDSIIFTGMVNPNDVYKYYKISDVFVTASTSETQGLTYIESLASGCPVICKWDKCIEGVVVNGRTGYSYENVEEFIKAVEKITDISNKEYIKNNCLAKANEYSSDNFGRSIERIYFDKILLKDESVAV